jgi:FkbM family methyltransferase
MVSLMAGRRGSGRSLKAAWRELRGRSAIRLPGGTYRLAWGARHSTRGRDYELLYRLAQGRSCVFDIGAKVGVTAMCMAGAMDGGTVVAFEASETSCRVIDRNIRLNALERRIVAVNAVVGSTSGDSCVYHWRAISGRSGIVLPPRGAVPVRKLAVALDDFVRQNDWRPGLVKIDVEGAEQQVIAGMQTILREDRPDVALELHAWPEMPAARNAGRILQLLEPLGYRMFWLARGRFLDDPSALAAVEEPKHAVEARARFLLLPHGRTVPGWVADLDEKDCR